MHNFIFGYKICEIIVLLYWNYITNISMQYIVVLHNSIYIYIYIRINTHIIT